MFIVPLADKDIVGDDNLRALSTDIRFSLRRHRTDPHHEGCRFHLCSIHATKTG